MRDLDGAVISIACKETRNDRGFGVVRYSMNVYRCGGAVWFVLDVFLI